MFAICRAEKVVISELDCRAALAIVQCLSITMVYCVKTSIHIFKLLHRWVATQF